TDIDCYLQTYVVIDPVSNGWQWGIDENGVGGALHHGRVEMVEGENGYFGLRGATHPTEKEAMAAALGYLWKCRQDLVAIARNDAIEAEKYRAKA
ncbi:anti-CRISPR protein AcrFgp36, partial [Pseudomonas aeruginosa]|nr:anti-CRISPR protein AcrFgp36 [Pseudomonas aeruginosa]HEJ2730929.1 anti-CRISPR protein AcrFgp36 [Pseudomonas aeruginosa]